jgi:hypothetical protein
VRDIRHWAAVAAATVAFAACGEDQGPTATIESVEVQANPINVISAVSVVTGAGFDAAFVRYWQEGGAAQESPPYEFEDGVARVPVLGLEPSATYLVETSLLLGDSVITGVDTSEFLTDTLPDWIPAIGAQGSDTTPGFVALSLPGGPVIVDNTGRVVWYKHTPDGTLNSFQVHPDGHYTLLGLSGSDRVFGVLNELGEEIGNLSCVGRPTRFHEVMLEADGSAWILCDETRTMDLSGVGGVDSAQVTATVVQHLSIDGELLFEWNAFDHFEITDLPAVPNGPNVNFTHGNGIDFDEDGNLLLSFRSLNEITKVDSATGEVLWRFGGVRNQFSFVNDPDPGFARQHGVRRAGPGMVQLLDNGSTPPSRGARYLLNPVTKTAVLVVGFEDGPDTFASVGGSTQYLTNGHALISFGRGSRVVEFDEAGNLAWEVTGIDGLYIFRAQRIGSLYAPGSGDPTR